MSERTRIENHNWLSRSRKKRGNGFSEFGFRLEISARVHSQPFLNEAGN